MEAKAKVIEINQKICKMPESGKQVHWRIRTDPGLKNGTDVTI